MKKQYENIGGSGIGLVDVAKRCITLESTNDGDVIAQRTPTKPANCYKKIETPNKAFTALKQATELKK